MLQGRASVLFAVPAVRHVLEALDTASCKKGAALPSKSLGKAPHVPLSARTPKSFASGMTAQLLSLTPRAPGSFASRPCNPRQRLVLFGQDFQKPSH